MANNDVEMGSSSPSNSPLPQPQLSKALLSGLLHKDKSFDDDDVIYINHHPIPAKDVQEAWTGFLAPGLMEKTPYKLGNPSPMGLAGFALTTFVLGCVNAQVRGLTASSIVTPIAIFYGGALQLIAGILEIVVNNTFGGLALGSYGAFWISFGVISLPQFHATDGYDAKQVADALGLFLTGWGIFTFILALCTVRSTIAFFLLFALVDVVFWMLAAAHFAHDENGTPHVGATKGSGYIAIIAALLAWYGVYSGIATPESTFTWLVPVSIPMPWSHSRADFVTKVKNIASSSSSDVPTETST